MLRHRSWFLLVCLCGLALLPAVGDEPASKALLLNVSKGQIPNDTGLDDQTKISVVESPELGGKALKIPLAAEDSFGVRAVAVPNWKKFERFRFNAFNPDEQTVELELVVIHSKSTEYSTRIVEPIKLQPGKNEISIALESLTNSNGSAPDLTKVTRWYVADISKLETTFYVGDIWLEAGDVPPPGDVPPGQTSAGSKLGAGKSGPGKSGLGKSGSMGAGSGGPNSDGPSAAGPNGPQPLVGYRVKGKVGETIVDLTFTPFLIQTSDDSSSDTGGKGPGGKRPSGDGAGGKEPDGEEPSSSSGKGAGKVPNITKPVSFDTPEADAILSALEVFPANNPWNQDVSDWPLHPNSKNLIASIGAEKPLRYNPDMAFVLVPPHQKKIEVKLGEIAEESDPGPYPVPDITPIEGWPVHYQREKSQQTLDDVQRNSENVDGDRHAIVIDPANRVLYEFYQMQKTDNGWQATAAAIFDLKSNKLRQDGWTSADAAGLPMFPAVVRYDELKRGAIEHALRVTIVNTRRAYVYPATHFASDKTDENLPRMGERIRLRKGYNISSHSREVQTILKALKKYGMFVADNGIDWALSVTPDARIPELHAELRKIKGSDFEVVEAPEGYEAPE